jgi:zinc transport system ATP-binding protein
VIEETLNTTDSIISINHLFFRYGSQTVLDDISLEIMRGEFVGLIGPNGGGKTTLLKLLVGLEPPQSGSITVFGERPDRSNLWRSKVGVVPQFTATTPKFPVLACDVVEMGTYVRGMAPLSSADRKQRVNDSLKMVGAADFGNKPMWDLSGGYRQRIFVARALACRPELLLLDEPTVGVDAQGQDLLYEWIETWRKERNLTVILISHDVGVIAPLCDKLACLNVQLHFHDRPDKFTGDAVQKAYGCPAEVVFHSTTVPHRVVGEHKH